MKIVHIALNTVRENIRDKVLYNVLFFALVIIIGSVILGQVSVGHEEKIIVDIGLAAISIFGTLIAIFIGTGLVYKELDKRTIFNLISKPVRRYEFILGKYTGFMLTLLINTLLMAMGVYLGLMCFQKALRPEHLNLLPAIVMIYVQLMVVTVIALLFSTFSTPILSAVFTLSLWIIGHFSNEIKQLSALIRAKTLGLLCSVLYYVLPNFNNFALVEHETLFKSAGHFHPPRFTLLLLSAAYGLLYTSIVLMIAIVIFQKRDFK